MALKKLNFQGPKKRKMTDNKIVCPSEAIKNEISHKEGLLEKYEEIVLMLEADCDEETKEMSDKDKSFHGRKYLLGEAKYAVITCIAKDIGSETFQESMKGILSEIDEEIMQLNCHLDRDVKRYKESAAMIYNDIRAYDQVISDTKEEIQALKESPWLTRGSFVALSSSIINDEEEAPTGKKMRFARNEALGSIHVVMTIASFL